MRHTNVDPRRRPTGRDHHEPLPSHVPAGHDVVAMPARPRLATRAAQATADAWLQEQLAAPPHPQPARALPRRTGRISLSMACGGLIIGGLLWLIGARYTIDGVPVLLNSFLAFFRIPMQFATPVVWPVYLAMAWLPVLISRIEWAEFPVRRVGTRWVFARSEVATIWLVTAGADMFTTLQGVSVDVSSPVAVLRFIAANIVVALAWSGFLTFVPEWLMRLCWPTVRRRLSFTWPVLDRHPAQ